MEGGAAPKQEEQQSSQMTQEQLDEMQKQIVLNEEYQNKLREEIEQTTPFVGPLTPIAVLQLEYANNFKFGDCFDELGKRYSQVRRLRRDGNCFYRAYLFQVFEYFINSTGTLALPQKCELYDNFVKAVDGSKKDLMAIGYDEIAIEDFHEIFLNETKKLAEIEPAKAQEHLLKLLCNKEEATQTQHQRQLE